MDNKATDVLSLQAGQSQNGHNELEPIPVSELMAMDFPEAAMVIKDILPVGVTLLAGKPKKGKSWMALSICESVATGGTAFGVKDVAQGAALYLALEDNPRRIRKRLAKVLGERPAPGNMYVKTEWRRMDEGGDKDLDEWLTRHPDARLVFIDTLAKVRKPARGVNVYAEDYAALESLLPLAQKHNVAIVVVYHLRKAAAYDPVDEISSSTGLTAGVDGFLILRRTPGSKGPTLYVDGRDIEEQTEYALLWNLDTATWTIEGDAQEVHLSKERADILIILNRSRIPMTPKQVTEALGPGAKHANVKALMWRMLGDGQLLKTDKGAYYPANPTDPDYPDYPDYSDNPDDSDYPNADDSVDDSVLDTESSGDAESDYPAFPHRNGDNDGSVNGVNGVIEPGKAKEGSGEVADQSDNPSFSASVDTEQVLSENDDVLSDPDHVIRNEREAFELARRHRGAWGKGDPRGEQDALQHPLGCDCESCISISTTSYATPWSAS